MGVARVFVFVRSHAVGTLLLGLLGVGVPPDDVSDDGLFTVTRLIAALGAHPSGVAQLSNPNASYPFLVTERPRRNVFEIIHKQTTA